jgi:hypothetical protein
MQPQASIPTVPTNIPTFKPISASLVATTVKPSSKPTTLTAKLSKQECHHKQGAARLCNDVTSTSQTTCIRTQAQIATAAAQVAPPSLNTCSRTRQLGMPPPTRQPGFAAAVMKQQWHQCRLLRLTCRITQLENKVHQAMAVMDKDTGKLLNYRQLMNSPTYKKSWSLSAANKFGQLANDIGGHIKKSTNTIKFIFQHQVLADRMKEFTYGQFVCLVRPEKAEPN